MNNSYEHQHHLVLSFSKRFNFVFYVVISISGVHQHMAITVLVCIGIKYSERTSCNFLLRCAYGKGNFQRRTNACTDMIKRSLNISSLCLSTSFFHLYVFLGGKLWLNTCTVFHV